MNGDTLVGTSVLPNHSADGGTTRARLLKLYVESAFATSADFIHIPDLPDEDQLSALADNHFLRRLCVCAVRAWRQWAHRAAQRTAAAAQVRSPRLAVALFIRMLMYCVVPRCSQTACAAANAESLASGHIEAQRSARCSRPRSQSPLHSHAAVGFPSVEYVALTVIFV